MGETLQDVIVSTKTVLENIFVSKSKNGPKQEVIHGSQDAFWHRNNQAENDNMCLVKCGQKLNIILVTKSEA